MTDNNLNIVLNLEDRDAEELVLLLQGYYHLLTDKELPVHQEKDRWAEDAAPPYHTQHRVQTDDWNYIDSGKEKSVDLSTAPAYKPSSQKMLTANGHVGTLTPAGNDGNKLDSTSSKTNSTVDNNMNKMNNGRKTPPPPPPPRGDINNLNVKAKFNATSAIDWEKDKDKDDQKDVIEAKNDEVIRRVAEMQQIVHSAENYLTGRTGPTETVPRVQVFADQLPKLKAADSLLLLAQVNRESESELETVCKLEVQDEPSGSDTDSISTPTDSPSHRCELQRKLAKPQNNASLIGSSFGLHSPDNLPFSMHKANLKDLMKKLQCENNDLPYPFAEGTLYLDPDIIDLTMIPPPMTPDREGVDLPFAVSMPPTPFADRGSLELELRALEAHFYQEAFALQKDIAEQTRGLKNGGVGGSPPPPPPKGWGAGDNLDNFISAVSVPPPPPPSEAQLAALTFPIHSPVVELTPEDISAFIIPPPPASSSSESDCEMIARFQEAADSINEVMGAPGTTPGVRRKCIGSSSSKPLFHLQAPPPRPLHKRPTTSENQGDSSGYETQASSVVSCDARDLPGGSPDDVFGKMQADDASVISGGSSGTHGDNEDEGLDVAELSKSFYVNEAIEIEIGSPFKRQMSMPRSVKNAEGVVIGAHKPPVHPQSVKIARTANGGGGGNLPLVPKPVLPKSPPGHSPKRALPKPPVYVNGRNEACDTVEITMNGLDNDLMMTTEVYSFVLPQEESDLLQLLGTEAPLQKAESLVAKMVGRLDEILDGCLANREMMMSADSGKLATAKDSLITEARRFVTASKLFVKSIAEGEAKLTNNLGVCVVLLERMLKVTEVLAANTSSPIQTQNVTLKVRDVAATYVQTTRAAAAAVGKAINDPDMNILMQQATTLAAVLTALMRTLRAFNP
uniref:FERM domain-containing protein n=1 Tax=Strigamia maritima TaxID=126957 RepID=T1IM84_STRMM